MTYCIRALWLAVVLFAVNMPLVAANYYSLHPEFEEDLDASAGQVRYSSTYVQLQASIVSSFGTIKDAEGSAVVRKMEGWRTSAFVRVYRTLSVGAQFEKLSEKDQRTNLITPIKQQTWAALVKWTITPDTQPQLYIVAGAGQTKYSSRFPLARNTLDGHSMSWIGAIGADIRIWRTLHLQGEYQLQYDTKPWKNFALTGPRTRQSLSAALSIQF